MQTDDVSASQKLILAHVREAQLFVKAGLLCPCADNDFHVECARSSAYKLANITESNEANRAALDAPAVSKHALVPVTCLEHSNTFSHPSVNR